MGPSLAWRVVCLWPSQDFWVRVRVPAVPPLTKAREVRVEKEGWRERVRIGRFMSKA
jgi:hypothetical protein